ncbi:acetoacetate decarboxylase family protein [soil metagenome]
MPYQFQPGHMYRMPTHFGPTMGPRQGPDGRKFECKDNPKVTTLAVSFLTNQEQLAALLPERFELSGEPVVTVYASYMTEIEWLAGRGYNVLGVAFPATFRGEQATVTGSFLTVLWENLTDPIISGREELGFAKVYCELPEPTVLRGAWHLIASWLGFKFLDLEINQLRQQSAEEIAALAETSMGQLHYKYMPRTGEWGVPDVAYACLSPTGHSNRVVKERWVGDGVVRFHPARWEDMPTQYNIVNTFHALEIKAYRGASVTKSVGGEDLSAQQILR